MTDKEFCRRDITVLSPLPLQHFKAVQTIDGVRGEPLGSLRLAPPLYIRTIIKTLRQTPKLEPAARGCALIKAAEIFSKDVLCGLSAEEYSAVTIASTGLSQDVIKASLHYIAEALAAAGKAEGLGQTEFCSLNPNKEQGRQGCAQWKRKGDVLAVLAPGNAPGVHALWPQAIALGYKAAVRPSAREPWTAQRLAAALAAAGLQDYVALIPTDYSGAETLAAAADLALLYGGDETVRHYAGKANVLVQGPGRSKIIIGKNYPPQAAPALIWQSVTDLGGLACVCASSVLVEGDAEAAQRLARDFYAFAKEKFADSSGRRQWGLRFSKQRFALLKQAEAQFSDNLVGSVACEENFDGTFWAMPLICLAENIRDPLIQTELPFAAVSFAPFNHAVDMPFVGDTLVLTVASDDESLIAELNELRGIHNFYVGSVPTTWMRPDIPHDGFLAEFLMTSRGYKIGEENETDLFSAPLSASVSLQQNAQ